MYTQHLSCRSCGYGSSGPGGIKSAASKEKLIPVFDLGIQPLANDFVEPSQDHAGYAPLEVLFCPRCTLAQLSVVVDPKVLYSHYSYVTSQSDTMREHFSRLADTIGNEQEFESVLEIGSNDGTFLKYLATHGTRVVGIDPANNLTSAAMKDGIPTVTSPFNSKAAEKAVDICQDAFDVIIARHVFCHVDDWREFIGCLSIPSHKGTLVCIEVPYVGNLLKGGEFDTIYHEHLSYLSIRAMQAALNDSPFRIHNIVQFSIHGGAILIMLRRKDAPDIQNPIVQSFIESESFTVETWKQFSDRSSALIQELRHFVKQEREMGKRIFGFGASAKSTVWVNACKFTRKDLECITDTTIQKWYRMSPGTDIPVTDEGAIIRELPDYAVCFAWNFRREILSKNELARSKGVKFVFPIPNLEVV